MNITDVTGVGQGAVFLIEGEANILFEAGMAYCADKMIQNVKTRLKGGKVDAVLLSHSHYDHVAGLPAVRREWPGVTVYGSGLAQEILRKPSALATIRRLSGEAADAAGLEWERDYSDEALKVDVGLSDEEEFFVGDHTVKAFETIGHTRCSMSYLVDQDLMLCSETVGVLSPTGDYMPSFLVDYKEAERSIQKSRQIPVKEIILNHYGLVSKKAHTVIWDILLDKLKESRRIMVETMNCCDSDEACLKELERIFHSDVDKKDQPDEAFYINARSMMKTLRRQFPGDLKKEAVTCS